MRAYFFSTDQTVELWANTCLQIRCDFARQIKSKYRWRKNQLKSNKALGKYAADLKLFLCAGAAADPFPPLTAHSARRVSLKHTNYNYWKTHQIERTNEPSESAGPPTLDSVSMDATRNGIPSTAPATPSAAPPVKCHRRGKSLKSRKPWGA